jgi:putative solute:sodium symporter small subunit
VLLADDVGKDPTMLKQWQKADLAKVLLGNEQRLAWGELRKVMLATLGAWIAYFLVINMFVRVLNKIVIPVLEMPLGFYLAIQGTAVMFGVALYILAKRTDRSQSS